MLHHFCDVKFQNLESVRHLTEQVFHLLLRDSELPVKVDAALALQFLVKYQVLCEWGEGRERGRSCTERGEELYGEGGLYEEKVAVMVSLGMCEIGVTCRWGKFKLVGERIERNLP